MFFRGAEDDSDDLLGGRRTFTNEAAHGDKKLEEISEEVQLLLEEMLVIDYRTKRNEPLVRVGS